MLWMFEAVDTLFFRNGTPFNAGESSYSGLTGTFPPPVATLQGAVRSALAKGQGWSPSEPDKWPSQLGDADYPGDLSFKGPYLFYLNGKPEILFPVPLLLAVGKDEGETKRLGRLIPGSRPVTCDLGETVRLPVLRDILNGPKILSGNFITSKGLSAVLDGGLPEMEDIINPSKLWAFENRVGIARNNKTRTVLDGMLYSCRHVRTCKRIAVGIFVEDAPELWEIGVEPLMPLGGEGRLAKVDVLPEKQGLVPVCPDLESCNGMVKFTVSLLTPGCYGGKDSTARAVIEGPPGIPGTCLSACVGKLEQVGGWDLYNKKPRPLQALVPAGSTWFFEAEEKDVHQVAEIHGKCLGSSTVFGYGQIVIGRWEE